MPVSGNEHKLPMYLGHDAAIPSSRHVRGLPRALHGSSSDYLKGIAFVERRQEVGFVLCPLR